MATTLQSHTHRHARMPVLHPVLTPVPALPRALGAISLPRILPCAQVRVYCRVRPVDVVGVPSVRMDASAGCVSVACHGSEHTFNFNRVFAPSTSQQAVFQVGLKCRRA